MRAYQRIRGDEKTTEKTKRALAVALALLDERAPATSTTGPVATIASAAAQKPPVDDADLKT